MGGTISVLSAKSEKGTQRPDPNGFVLKFRVGREAVEQQSHQKRASSNKSNLSAHKRQRSASTSELGNISKLNSNLNVKPGNIKWLLTEVRGRLLLKDFEFIRLIGRGLMGKVHLARTLNSKKYLAIKSIKKSYIERHKDERHINNEKNILCAMRSSFCVKVWERY